MSPFSNWRADRWVMVLVLVILALVPVFVAFSGNYFYLDVATRLIILAIAAVSLNLILGYGGMISFGHAAYLGIGAYAVGIPAYYEIYDGYLQITLAVVLSALFALITGAICLRTRGIHFIMITMAFSQMLFFGLVSIEEYGGDDGLVIEYRSEFSGLLDLEQATQLYYAALVSLVVFLFLIGRLIQARFGMVIQGTKGNDRRMRSLGFDTYRYQLACYVISGAICGYAGALLGNFTNFISPEMMDWTRSGELIFMVVLGGGGTLFGPVIGAAAFILLEEVLSGLWLYWQFIFGLILILVVIFAKRGLMGLLSNGRGQ
ncbi:MAG: branched-chain amino acid ABC transporter permease [Nisaea sp.]|nr:branched-chain amino acid ABC transporter permease [Nisaea sp.]OUX97983.1 MAG: branched-chain amino acid ABC transporter permease [Candidatus Endolissoclinum sp. TMED26]